MDRTKNTVPALSRRGKRNQRYPADLWTALQPDNRRSKAISNIKQIVNYIDEHYSEEINLSSVAEQFHYSTAHLSRMFKDHIGFNFHEYPQNVRLMHCVNLLKENNNILLTDCAMNNGFPNIKSFIHTFKKYFGCTPSEWLKNQG